MPDFSIPLGTVQSFILVLLRVMSILLTAPIFGGQNVPVPVKVGLGIGIAVALTPHYSGGGAAFALDPLPFAIAVVTEIAVGVAIGLCVDFIFAGIQMAGQLVGFQMGLSIANVMDPMTSAQVPVLGQLQYLFALLVFLITDAHHWFIRAISESLRIVVPFKANFGPEVSDHLMHLAGGMFIVGLKTSAPVVVCLLIATAAIGLVARTVPQMNVFFVVMPAKILLGFAFLMFSLPFAAMFFKELFIQAQKDIWVLLKSLS